jgi:Putative transposase
MHYEWSFERVARYITRPALAIDSIRRREDGRLEIQTPLDPRTGATVRIFDPLEWIHAVTAHIPDRGQHQVRYYGALSNRARVTIAGLDGQSCRPSGMQQKGDEEKIDSSRARRASWARLLRKIFEVDPLLCTCGAQMKIVSFITEPRVVDRILRHLASEACKARDPFEPRAPPAAASPSPT